MDPVMLAVVAEYLQRQQAQGKARKDARAEHLASYASGLGYPMAGVQAAAARRRIDDMEGANYLTNIMPMPGGR